MKDYSLVEGKRIKMLHSNRSAGGLSTHIIMTQEERWNAQYERMMEFMKTNHRRPSKHRLEEHDMLNWFKATKKMIAKGDYPPERLKKFEHLMEVANEFRRKNQYE